MWIVLWLVKVVAVRHLLSAISRGEVYGIPARDLLRNREAMPRTLLAIPSHKTTFPLRPESGNGNGNFRTHALNHSAPMLGTLLKAAAYTMAPKATFAVRHPVTAVQLKKLPFDLKYAFAPRLTALGAAVVAVPLGMWIGRRMDGYGARREEILRRTERPGAL